MYVEKAYNTVDGDVKPGGPLGAFREEQAMSRHRVSPSPFLPFIIIPHNRITLYKQLHLQLPQPQLSPVHYTLIPHVMWSAQAVRDLKIDHT